jgi:lysine decarboxylase
MNEELRKSAPLLDAYLSYFETDRLPFTIPGHKQKAKRLDSGLGLAVDSDVPLYGGLDEIKLTKGTLKHAEALAASLWGCDYARFSTGGSTHANQAIIMALGKPGDKIAVARTAHRSVLSALVLAGLEPIWLTPEIDLATGIPNGIPATELDRALLHKPIAVLLTEPSYLGTISDLPALITKSHENSIPVIIDAAWGGHLGFNENLPKHALQLGADALITSVHKTLPGYSAAALLLAQGTILNLARIEPSFETTHTTSPAGAPLASIDACRALLQTRGTELTSLLLSNVAEFKSAVQSNFDVPIFMEQANFSTGRFDPAKIVLRANMLGLSGIEVENQLQKENIRVEMADRDTIVFLATLADDKRDFKQLEQALVLILKQLQGPIRESQISLSWSVSPTKGISTRDAFFADTEFVSTKDAIGRISADLIAPYPPGVAVLAPGEVITEQIVTGLAATKDAGVRIAYASDPTLNTYRVTK